MSIVVRHERSVTCAVGDKTLYRERILLIRVSSVGRACSAAGRCVSALGARNDGGPHGRCSPAPISLTRLLGNGVMSGESLCSYSTHGVAAPLALPENDGWGCGAPSSAWRSVTACAVKHIAVAYATQAWHILASAAEDARKIKTSTISWTLLVRLIETSETRARAPHR